MCTEYKKQIRGSVREMDREIRNMERAEQKSMAEARKMGKAGNNDTMKIYAKEIARTRTAKKRMIVMKSHLQGMELKVAGMKSQQTMMRSMKGVTNLMTRMNAQMRNPAMQKVIAEFQRASMEANMTSEIQDEMMDDAFGMDLDEGDVENEVTKITDEIMLELQGGLGQLPAGQVGQAQATAAPQQDDLQARLNALG